MNETHSPLYRELAQFLLTLDGNGSSLEIDRAGEVMLRLKSADGFYQLLSRLKQDAIFSFDYLSDLTAYDNVDGEDGEDRFITVYQLFSTRHHHRLRVKVGVSNDRRAALPSVIGLWPAANWLEREVYDMYGIVFQGHPNLKRILMDERFTGHPLRKEYPMKQREPFADNVRINL